MCEKWAGAIHVWRNMHWSYSRMGSSCVKGIFMCVRNMQGANHVCGKHVQKMCAKNICEKMCAKNMYKNVCEKMSVKTM